MKQKQIHCLCKLSPRWRWESGPFSIPLHSHCCLLSQWQLRCSHAHLQSINFPHDFWAKTHSWKGRNCCSDLDVKNQNGDKGDNVFLVLLRLSHQILDNIAIKQLRNKFVAYPRLTESKTLCFSNICDCKVKCGQWKEECWRYQTN